MRNRCTSAITVHHDGVHGATQGAHTRVAVLLQVHAQGVGQEGVVGPPVHHRPGVGRDVRSGDLPQQGAGHLHGQFDTKGRGKQ
jgi:hypothetical protein